MDATPVFLHALSSRIAGHLRRHGEADFALARQLAATAQPDWQLALCRSLLTSDAFAAQVAERSWRQGNGFLQVLLLDRGFKLQLQLGFPGFTVTRHIHDHRGSIASTILAGVLRGDIWVEATRHDRVDLLGQEYHCHAASQDQPAHMQPLARTPLRLLGRTCHLPGDSYGLPRSTLHRICNHGEHLVATLMCTDPAVASHTRLIVDQEGLWHEPAATPLSMADLRDAIARFMDLTRLGPAAVN